jgi:hypothetical protein
VSGLDEGWYLMSVRDVEIELARARGDTTTNSKTKGLTTVEALAYRDAGNLPDEFGRSLRLVLRVDGAIHGASELDVRRAIYEPDFHDAPSWRRPGSVPVTIVPLGAASESPRESTAWWEDPDLASLEEEWTATGRVDDIVVPAAYRGFVYKTVLALRRAGRPVTIDTIVGSVARWTRPAAAEEIRSALQQANSR